jgi:hypothetical protein
VPDDWRDLRETVTLPPGALDAAKALRYGEPTDIYTWDYVAEAALLAAAPLIRAAEQDRIARLAEEYGAVHPTCPCGPGAGHPEHSDGGAAPFADLIRADPRA